MDERSINDIINEGMEVRKSIIFNKLVCNEELTADIVCSELSRNHYSDKSGIGTLGVAIDEGVVHVEVLMKIPTYINSYDPNERTFNKTVVDVFEEVVVDLDFNNYILYSSSASSKLNKAKAFMRNLFGGKLAYDNIHFPHPKVFEWLEKEEFQYNILSMSIRKFKYDESAIGRFSVQISSKETGLKLMDEYKEEVRNVVLKVEPNGISSFVMQCAMQNTIALKCEESDYWTIVEIIKRNL